jgi:hypothetical protein
LGKAASQNVALNLKLIKSGRAATTRNHFHAAEWQDANLIPKVILLFFNFGFINQHHRDVILDGVNPAAFDTFQPASIWL